MTSVFCLLCYQGSTQVSGCITDSLTGEAISSAQVLIKQADGRLLKSLLSDSVGCFRFFPVTPDAFALTVSHINYGIRTFLLDLSKSNVQLQLRLSQVQHTLTSLIVYATPVPIVEKVDTIQYAARAYLHPTDRVVEDLLKHVPTIQVDKDGNINAEGQKITRIKVNGKDYFGNNLKMVSKEFPANIVDKIEVINDYGDFAAITGIKEGIPGKILNIELIKSKTHLFFGKLSAGAGTAERYETSLSGTYFNGTKQVSLIGNANNTNTGYFDKTSATQGLTAQSNNSNNLMDHLAGNGVRNVQDYITYLKNSSTADETAGVSSDRSLGSNYRFQLGKHIDVYGNLMHAEKSTTSIQRSVTSYFFQSPSFQYYQSLNALQHSNTNEGTLNIEYQATPRDYIKLVSVVQSRVGVVNSFNDFNYFLNAAATPGGGSTSLQKKQESFGFQQKILLNHRFRKPGRNLSFSANLAFARKNIHRDLATVGGNQQQVNSSTFFNQQNEYSIPTRSTSLQVTYTEPLAKNIFMNIVLGMSNIQLRSNIYTVSDSNHSMALYDSMLSNEYTYSYNNYKAVASIRAIQKKITYSLGVSFLYTTSQSHANPAALFRYARLTPAPVADITVQLPQHRILKLNYSLLEYQPMVEQLQPFTDHALSPSITTGNPNLLPALYHNLNLFFNSFDFLKSKGLYSLFSFSTVQNNIINSNSNTGFYQQKKPVNANGFYSIKESSNFFVPIKKKTFVLSLNSLVNYSRSVFYKNTVPAYANTFITAHGILLEYNKPGTIETGIGTTFNTVLTRYGADAGHTYSNMLVLSNSTKFILSRTAYIRYDMSYSVPAGINSRLSSTIFMMNASSEFSLFHQKNLTMKASIYNLFNQRTNISRMGDADYTTEIQYNVLPRYFMLSVQYRLQRERQRNSSTAKE